MYELIDIWDFYLNDTELRPLSRCISTVHNDISICFHNFSDHVVSIRNFCFKIKAYEIIFL